jgi:hypothetical protein
VKVARPFDDAGLIAADLAGARCAVPVVAATHVTPITTVTSGNARICLNGLGTLSPRPV